MTDASNRSSHTEVSIEIASVDDVSSTDASLLSLRSAVWLRTCNRVCDEFMLMSIPYARTYGCVSMRARYGSRGRQRTPSIPLIHTLIHTHPHADSSSRSQASLEDFSETHSDLSEPLAGADGSAAALRQAALQDLKEMRWNALRQTAHSHYNQGSELHRQGKVRCVPACAGRDKGRASRGRQRAAAARMEEVDAALSLRLFDLSSSV